VDNIITDIKEERRRQDKKWGIQKHNSFVWLSILGEEYGEACKELLESGETKNFRQEMVQVASVAIAAIECIDRRRNIVEK
jgi:hypothetical protein